MTVNELYQNCELKSQLKVMDAGTGRILCFKYNPEKHEEIGNLRISALWSDVNLCGSEYTRYAVPILCVFAYEKKR